MWRCSYCYEAIVPNQSFIRVCGQAVCIPCADKHGIKHSSTTKPVGGKI